MSQPSDRSGATPSSEPARRVTAGQLDARRRATIAKVIVAVVLLVVFLIFVIQNSEPVPVSFIFTDASIPLVWVFLGCAVFGGIIAYLVGRPGRRAMRRHIEDLERQRSRGKPPASSS